MKKKTLTCIKNNPSSSPSKRKMKKDLKVAWGKKVENLARPYESQEPKQLFFLQQIVSSFGFPRKIKKINEYLLCQI